MQSRNIKHKSYLEGQGLRNWVNNGDNWVNNGHNWVCYIVYRGYNKYTY